MEIYDVVKKLVGEIEPVGETYTDNARFENLKVMTDLVEKLLTDIADVATYEKDRHEYSRKRAGEFADKFLRSVGISE